MQATADAAKTQTTRLTGEIDSIREQLQRARAEIERELLLRSQLGEQLAKSSADAAAAQQHAHDLREELEAMFRSGAAEIHSRVQSAT